MGLFGNFNDNIAMFASKDVASPKTPAVSEDDISVYERVSRQSLEEIYLTDPQTFNTINKSKQLIMQAGYNIRVDKKGSQSKYDDFFKNMGNIGMKTNLSQLLSNIYHDKFLYGVSYIERVYDTRQEVIVDLKMIDPKLMDFARDNEGIIVVDRNQNPVGFTMDIGRKTNYRGDIIPIDGLSSKVSLDPNHIFFLAFRIAYFRMFTYGNRFDAVGVVEPAIKDINRKHKIEDATANSIHNAASYPIVGYVGDANRSASQSLMNNTLDAMKNLSHSRYMVFQYPTKLETLEVKQSEQVNEALRYFRANQSAASGMALGFSIGTGEAINRSTLSTQQEMLDISLDSEAKNTAEEFNVQILDELNRVNGYGSSAKLIWGNVASEDKNDKASRLFDAVSSGVLAPGEIRDYILMSEDIVRDDKLYNEYINKDIVVDKKSSRTKENTKNKLEEDKSI
jgi:hypothetical protein